MRPFAVQLMLALVLLTIPGCAVQRHLDAGDTAAATGDHRAALYHYQRALGSQASLARDHAFMQKLATAESRVAFDQAVRLRAGGDYEQAIEHLRHAIDRDPAYLEPQQLLPMVLAQASQVRYVRAVESADAGKLHEAQLHLERALQQDMRNEQAAFARASLALERLPSDTPGLAEYHAASAWSAQRRWVESEQAFAAAIAAGPGLLPARAGLHEAKAQLAWSRRLTGQGADQIQRREMGPAIGSLTESLEVWPFNTQAQELLTKAREQLSLAEDRLLSATALASERKWEEALAQVNSGLAIDRSHAGLQTLRREMHQRAAADYDDQAKALAQAGRLVEAQREYARAVELDASLRSAATGLREVENNLAQSRRLQEAGQAHIQSLQLAGAVEVLTRSLEIWPFNERASELLADAKQKQARAQEIYQAAAAEGMAGRFEQAVLQTREGLAIDGSHAGLLALQAQLPPRAAAYYTQQADDHLAAGRVDQAQQAYAAALTFVGDFDGALSGMASTYQARGQALDARGLTGAALLYYSVGQTYDREHPISDALSGALGAVRNRAGMGLSLSVDAAQAVAVGPNQLGDAVQGVLAGYQSGGLSLGGPAQPYALQLTIRDAVIGQSLVGAVDRAHEFTVLERRHNEAYDRIADRLRHEEALLHRCRGEYDHHEREHEAARRQASSVQRPIEPRKPADEAPRTRKNRSDEENQEAQERYRQAQERYEREMQVYHRQMRDYEQAQAHVKSHESRCSQLSRALSEQERVVKHWRHQLSCTPHEIQVAVLHRWPYTIETYAKHGRLQVKAELIDTATGKVVKQFDPQAEFHAQDDLLLNANPNIGLGDDRLDLPTDQRVRGELVDSVAQSAGSWAVDVAVEHRLALIGAQAQALRQAGKDEAALEAEVDAAVLLGIVDGKASWDRIDALARQHVR